MALQAKIDGAILFSFLENSKIKTHYIYHPTTRQQPNPAPPASPNPPPPSISPPYLTKDYVMFSEHVSKDGREVTQSKRMKQGRQEEVKG